MTSVKQKRGSLTWLTLIGMTRLAAGAEKKISAKLRSGHRALLITR